jgi:hypothetical protein
MNQTILLKFLSRLDLIIKLVDEFYIVMDLLIFLLNRFYFDCLKGFYDIIDIFDNFIAYFILLFFIIIHIGIIFIILMEWFILFFMGYSI